MIRSLLLALILTANVNAGNWIEGAWEDSTNWVETAWNDTWNWAGHNPGLAIVAGVAIIGVTEPIVLSQAAMTVITPIYAGYTGFTRYIADATFPNVAARLFTGGAESEFEIELQMEAFSSINGNSALGFFETSSMADNLFLDEVEFSQGGVKQIPFKDIASAGSIGAMLVGSAYMVYETLADGVDWSEGAFNEVIIVINDSACWLANGAHEECKDFLINEIITSVEEENKTDNTSFFKQIVMEGEEFTFDEGLQID